MYIWFQHIIDTTSSLVKQRGSWNRFKHWSMTIHPVLLLACVLVWYYLCQKLVSLGDSAKENPIPTRLPLAGGWASLAVGMQPVPCKASKQASVEIQLWRPHHQADFLEAPKPASNWIPPHNRHIHKENVKEHWKDFAVKSSTSTETWGIWKTMVTQICPD